MPVNQKRLTDDIASVKIKIHCKKEEQLWQLN